MNFERAVFHVSSSSRDRDYFKNLECYLFQFCSIKRILKNIYKNVLSSNFILKKLITHSRVFTASSNISIENERSSFTTAWIKSSSIANDKYICEKLIRRSFGLKLYLSKSFTYKVKIKTYIINLIFDHTKSFTKHAQNLPKSCTLLNGWSEQFPKTLGKRQSGNLALVLFLCIISELLKQ